MRPQGLFVIFQKGAYENGVKPLLMVFMFQGKIKPRRKTMMCRALVGPFKISREKRSIDVCLFYYIY